MDKFLVSWKTDTALRVFLSLPCDRDSREELSKDSSIDINSSSDSHPSVAKPSALTNFTESKITMGSDSTLELGISKA